MRAVQHLWSSDRDDGLLVGRALRLAIARDLSRIYADVLHDPVPPDLRRLIDGLEHLATSERLPPRQWQSANNRPSSGPCRLAQHDLVAALPHRPFQVDSGLGESP